MVPVAESPSRVTTWVFVRTYPSLLSTTPEPVPPSSLAVTSIVTTDGPALAATAVVLLTLSLLLMVTVCGPETTVPCEPLLALTAQAATPAPDAPPSTAPTTRAPTSGPTLRFVAGEFAGSPVAGAVPESATVGCGAVGCAAVWSAGGCA